MTKRKQQILLAILSPILAVWCVYEMVQMTRQRDTRDIRSDIAVAVQLLRQSPAGVQRVEDFALRLRKINTGHAPAEVQRALDEYIAAVEQWLICSKAQQDPAVAEPAIAEKKQALEAAISKYE